MFMAFMPARKRPRIMNAPGAEVSIERTNVTNSPDATDVGRLAGVARKGAGTVRPLSASGASPRFGS